MDWGLIITNALRAAVGLDTVIFALAAIGLNVHFGYTGLLNFGQAAFLGVGRVRPGGHVAHLRAADAARRRVGLLAAVVLALLLGVPTLRLRADYLAIVTIAAAEIVRLRRALGDAVEVHRRLGRPAGVRRGFYCSTPIPTGRYGIGRVSSTSGRWVSRSAGSLVLLSCLLVYLADAQPLGPRAQGDPRGRGRRPEPGQERLRLQAAEPGARRRARLPRRLHDGVRQRRRSSRTASAPTTTFYASRS